MGMRFSEVLWEVVGNDGFVDGKYRIRIYNNNLRFLNNVPHNANVVDFADLGSSSRAPWRPAFELALGSLWCSPDDSKLSGANFHHYLVLREQ
jgi:hypothetical protein